MICSTSMGLVWHRAATGGAQWLRPRPEPTSPRVQTQQLRGTPTARNNCAPWRARRMQWALGLVIGPNQAPSHGSAAPDVVESRGLSEQEARRRLDAAGPNELRIVQRRTAAGLMLEQLSNPLVALLLGGAVVSAVVGHVLDAIAIGVIVTINAVVGFVQEHRAERAAAALRKLTAPRATVSRRGGTRTIPAREVVVGDVLVIEPG
ncbi:MAG: hypothetical protein K0V04_30535, partial [Deltaproteobacteria bacterium]|nr:hypothetical protein [Deltaproteobacteria bacterium]